MPPSGAVWPALTVGLVLAQGQVNEAELQKFQGTWALLSGMKEGKKIDSEQVKQSRLTVTGNKLELFTPHQHQDKITGTLTKLDVTKIPGEIQWVRTTGPNAGTTLKAIFEFEGPDRFQICFDPAGVAAPKKFETSPGSGHICHTWGRLKGNR